MRAPGSLLLASVFLLPLTPRSAHSADSCLDTTVRVTWDESLAKTAQGIVTELAIPSGLSLPPDAKGSVLGHIERLGSPSGGLFDATPHDRDGDGHADLLKVGLVNQSIPAGPFVRISFVCEGDEVPSVEKIRCTPDVAAPFGQIDSSCTVTADD